MRFKRGSKVEVLDKSEAPAGSWWSAEIISGNGHTYTVKYDCCPPVAVDRVPRESIRPCPPLVDAQRNWVPGDIVEVFDNSSWKLAEVSRVVGGDYFFVRLLGSLRQFRVHSSDLRLRQSWQYDKWVVIQQDSGRCNVSKTSNGGNLGQPMPRSCIKGKNFASDVYSSMENNKSYKELLKISSRGVKKRQHNGLYSMEAFNGAGRKMRAVVKEDFCHQLVAREPLPRVLEKGSKLEACKACFHRSTMMVGCVIFARLTIWLYLLLNLKIQLCR